MEETPSLAACISPIEGVSESLRLLDNAIDLNFRDLPHCTPAQILDATGRADGRSILVSLLTLSQLLSYLASKVPALLQAIQERQAVALATLKPRPLGEPGKN